jgi:hypothetical protein
MLFVSTEVWIYVIKFCVKILAKLLVNSLIKSKSLCGSVATGYS